MEFEKYKIKGSEKKYKTAGGKEKITVTKSIYLGSKSDLPVGEDVYIIPVEEFDEIARQNELNKNIDVDELLENMKQISKKLLKIEESNTGINKELHQAKNMVILLQQEKGKSQQEIDYLKDIISEYEQYNLLERIINRNPKKFIDKSEYELIETTTDSKKK